MQNTAELFPLDVRAELSGASTCLCSLLDFVSVKTYPQLSNESVLGVYGTFWMCSAICTIGFLYGIFCLPETKGKRLEEINNQFMANRKS